VRDREGARDPDGARRGGARRSASDGDKLSHAAFHAPKPFATLNQFTVPLTFCPFGAPACSSSTFSEASVPASGAEASASASASASGFASSLMSPRSALAPPQSETKKPYLIGSGRIQRPWV